MSWQPQEEGLNEVLSLLRNSSVANSEVQRAVSLRIEQLKTVPDFLAYLTFVLITCQQEAQEHRAVAGLLLKNSFSAHTVSSLDPQAAQAMAYVKAVIVQGLSDPDSQIRNTVSTVITSLIASDEPGAWPQALEAVTQGMGSSDIHMQEGCFSTLEKITEDCPHKLDIQVNGQSYMDHLVPEFIRYSSHRSAKIRLNCLSSLRQLLTLNFPSVMANIDDYMRALFARASDTSSDVRRGVCMALSFILQQRPDKIAPELDNVVDYVAYCTTDSDELVALEACEFWLTFAEEPDIRDKLLPYLPKIAPLLLKGMVYSEYDLVALDIDDEDEAVPDNETDIRPRNYGGRAHGAHESNTVDESGNRVGQSRDAAERAFDEDDEDEYDFEEDEDEDAAGDWNIRKCSAAAIDVMSVAFPEQLLPILLPYLKERLFSESWEERESGILALGAIAEGCMAGLEEHLSGLVPWLINALNDPKSLVRSITCWTLGRFSSWIVQVSLQDKNQFFIPAMEGLLRRVLDGNKRVQEAGCSAFATFEEEAGSELAPFLEPILRNLTFAFQKYQQKNLLILYDALGTLADSVGSHLGQPMYLEILMPPLIERWQRLDDDDAGLVPLLECLSSIAISANQAFAPYCQPVYQRSLTIIQSSLQQYQLFEQQPEVIEEPDRTFIVVSLDLLSGLTQGLAANMAQLIEASQPSLLHVMAMCLGHYEPPIRQSAHALLGDLAIACWPLLKPFVPQIMPAVIEQIVSEPSIDCVSVCNNATWSTGEIALQFNGDSAAFEPFVQPLMERLVPILLHPKAPKSLSENAAVTIGRMGLVCPSIIAPNLSTFAQAWCIALWEIKDNAEKDSAFRGFCMLISNNPQGLQDAFVHFATAVVKWVQPSAELDGMFRTIMQGFRSSLGAQWDAINLSEAVKTRLQERYGV